MIFTAEVKNPNNSNVEMYAMFESLNGSFSDSLMMFDDSLHNDGVANDGLYGNSILAPIIEQEFLAGLKTIDLDLNAITLHEDLDRFTTIGPLAVNVCTEMFRISNKIYY